MTFNDLYYPFSQILKRFMLTGISVLCISVFPAPLKLRPYGAIQTCLLLLLLILLTEL